MSYSFSSFLKSLLPKRSPTDTPFGHAIMGNQQKHLLRYDPLQEAESQALMERDLKQSVSARAISQAQIREALSPHAPNRSTIMGPSVAPVPSFSETTSQTSLHRPLWKALPYLRMHVIFPKENGNQYPIDVVVGALMRSDNAQLHFSVNTDYPEQDKPQLAVFIPSEQLPFLSAVLEPTGSFGITLQEDSRSVYYKCQYRLGELQQVAWDSRGQAHATSETQLVAKIENISSQALPSWMHYFQASPWESLQGSLHQTLHYEDEIRSKVQFASKVAIAGLAVGILALLPALGFLSLAGKGLTVLAVFFGLRILMRQRKVGPLVTHFLSPDGQVFFKPYNKTNHSLYPRLNQQQLQEVADA